MASGIIWTPEERTLQPSGWAAVNDAFLGGLVYLGGAHSVWRDHVGRSSTVPTGLTTTVSGGVGRTTLFNASDKITSPAFSGITGGNPQTLFAYFRASAAPASYDVVCSADDPSGFTIARLQYSADASAINYYSGSSPIAILTPVAGAWYAIAVIDDGVTLTTIINGAASVVTRTSATNFATNLYIGGYGGSGALYNSEVALAGFWNRARSVAGFRQVTRNPWQLVAPQRTPVFYSLSGGGGGGGSPTANRIMLLRRPGLSRIWR